MKRNLVMPTAVKFNTVRSITVFIVLICLQNIAIAEDRKFVSEEEVSFRNSDGVELHGTLAFPEKQHHNSKLIVLVSPPAPHDRNYMGLFKEISDSLVKMGYASFRFDTRSFTNKKYGNNGLSMFDQASDLGAAIHSLKEDKRFKKSKIGVMGHSEGGCVVAIEASQNSQIDL